MADWASQRKHPIGKALGLHDAEAYERLQRIPKGARTPEQQAEYKALQKRYEAYSRAQWLLSRGSPPAAPPPEPADTRQQELSSMGALKLEPLPGEKVYSGPVEEPRNEPQGEAAHVQTAPEPPPHDDDDNQEHDELQAPPDPPDAVNEREAWVRKRARKALAGWGAWLDSWGVWSPPEWVQKESARLVGNAVEKFGVLDRAPSKWVALGGAGASALLWGIPSLVALRRWRDGQQRKPSPRIVEEGKP